MVLFFFAFFSLSLFFVTLIPNFALSRYFSTHSEKGTKAEVARSKTKVSKSRRAIRYVKVGSLKSGSDNEDGAQTRSRRVV